MLPKSIIRQLLPPFSSSCHFVIPPRNNLPHQICSDYRYMKFRAALMEMALHQRELTSALASDLFLRFTNSYTPKQKLPNLRSVTDTFTASPVLLPSLSPTCMTMALQRQTHRNQADTRQKISPLNIRPGSDDTRAVMASFATLI